MKKLAIFMFVLLAFAPSCIENPNIVREKPFYDLKGSFETISKTISFNPPELVSEITGLGEVSHLGKSTFVALSTLIQAPPPPFSLNATSTMIAANGDEIYSISEGTAMPQEGTTIVHLTINHTIIGGTGRFKNAKGQYVGIGVSDRSTGIGTIDIEGKIWY